VVRAADCLSKEARAGNHADSVADSFIPSFSLLVQPVFAA
jgi:hypothetical protein